MDVNPLDVTPRTSAPDDLVDGKVPRRRSGRRGMLPVAVLVVALAASGFLLVKQIGEASLYYYNADEAVAQREEIGDRRFRVQGTFIGNKTEQADGDIVFTIAFRGARILVEHTGSQPALFKPGIPVVLDGRWAPDGERFLSDRIEVKHTEVYKEKNPEHVPPGAP